MGSVRALLAFANGMTRFIGVMALVLLAVSFIPPWHWDMTLLALVVLALLYRACARRMADHHHWDTVGRD